MNKDNGLIGNVEQKIFKITRFVLTILIILIYCSGLSACTIFNISKKGKVFVGNNEDWRNKNSYVKFIPASKSKFGRIYFGFGENCTYVFGGINDKGLFYDIASLPKRDDIVFDPQKITVDNEIYEKMLETCSNIEEAIALLKCYNISGLKRHHIMIVDKTGNSAIVEWGVDSLSIVRKTKDYQIMTNFNITLSDLDDKYTNERFKKVENQIKNSDNISVNDVRIILESVKNSGKMYPTVYSNIYDLVNNEIYLYNYHNFEEYYKIDINKGLDENGQSFHIPSIFSNLTLKEPWRVSEDEIELKWRGDADSYKLYISSSPDFNSCKPIEIAGTTYPTENKSNIGFLPLFLLPFFYFLINNRRLQISIYGLFVFLVFATNCDSTEIIDESKENSYTFSEFKTNKTYYWKVQAIKKTGITTTSITKQFSTSMNIND